MLIENVSRHQNRHYCFYEDNTTRYEDTSVFQFQIQNIPDDNKYCL